MSVLCLLPTTERPHAAMKQDLVGLGWRWPNEAQVLPLVPGEPEWVEYRHRDLAAGDPDGPTTRTRKT